VISLDGQELEIDSRPSDALALAVRTHVPIFVAESVMDEASSEPEADVESEEIAEGSDERLEVFKDFVETLDLDDMESPDNDNN
jgi:bifunctional DNase/RNase